MDDLDLIVAILTNEKKIKINNFFVCLFYKWNEFTCCFDCPLLDFLLPFSFLFGFGVGGAGVTAGVGGAENSPLTYLWKMKLVKMDG